MIILSRHILLTRCQKKKTKPKLEMLILRRFCSRYEYIWWFVSPLYTVTIALEPSLQTYFFKEIHSTTHLIFDIYHLPLNQKYKTNKKHVTSPNSGWHEVPSGKHSYGKWLFIVDFPIEHVCFFLKAIWVCVKTYDYQCEWVVHTTINPSYFDVNNRATFGFDPKPYVQWPVGVPLISAWPTRNQERDAGAPRPVGRFGLQCGCQACDVWGVWVMDFERFLQGKPEKTRWSPDDNPKKWVG